MSYNGGSLSGSRGSNSWENYNPITERAESGNWTPGIKATDNTRKTNESASPLAAYSRIQGKAFRDQREAGQILRGADPPQNDLRRPINARPGSPVDKLRQAVKGFLSDKISPRTRESPRGKERIDSAPTPSTRKKGTEPTQVQETHLSQGAGRSSESSWKSATPSPKTPGHQPRTPTTSTESSWTRASPSNNETTEPVSVKNPADTTSVSEGQIIAEQFYRKSIRPLESILALTRGNFLEKFQVLIEENKTIFEDRNIQIPEISYIGGVEDDVLKFFEKLDDPENFQIVNEGLKACLRSYISSNQIKSVIIREPNDQKVIKLRDLCTKFNLGANFDEISKGQAPEQLDFRKAVAEVQSSATGQDVKNYILHLFSDENPLPLESDQKQGMKFFLKNYLTSPYMDEELNSDKNLQYKFLTMIHDLKAPIPSNMKSLYTSYEFIKATVLEMNIDSGDKENDTRNTEKIKTIARGLPALSNVKNTCDILQQVLAYENPNEIQTNLLKTFVEEYLDSEFIKLSILNNDYIQPLYFDICKKLNIDYYEKVNQLLSYNDAKVYPNESIKYVKETNAMDKLIEDMKSGKNRKEIARILLANFNETNRKCLEQSTKGYLEKTLKEVLNTELSKATNQYADLFSTIILSCEMEKEFINVFSVFERMTKRAFKENNFHALQVIMMACNNTNVTRLIKKQENTNNEYSRFPKNIKKCTSLFNNSNNWAKLRTKIKKAGNVAYTAPFLIGKDVTAIIENNTTDDAIEILGTTNHEQWDCIARNISRLPKNGDLEKAIDSYEILSADKQYEQSKKIYTRPEGAKESTGVWKAC